MKPLFHRPKNMNLCHKLQNKRKAKNNFPNQAIWPSTFAVLEYWIIVNDFKIFVLAIDPPIDLYNLNALKRKIQMRLL